MKAHLGTWGLKSVSSKPQSREWEKSFSKGNLECFRQKERWMLGIKPLVAAALLVSINQSKSLRSRSGRYRIDLAWLF